MKFWRVNNLNKWQLDYFILCLMVTVVMFYCIPLKRHESDIWCWINWSIYIFEKGFSNAYKSGTDYPPLYLYILKLYTLFQSSKESIIDNIHFLKLITLIAHFTTTFFLLKFIIFYFNSTDKLKYGIFYFLNISVLYNSIVWGQVDEILTCFIVSAIYFSMQGKIRLSMCLYILALNIKIQAIIFLPIIALLIFPKFINQKLKSNLLTFVIIIGIQSIILFPFFLSNDLPKISNVIFNSVGHYPVLSMNAYNIWHLFFGHDSVNISDNIKFGGITYRHWGFILFFSLSFLTLFPLLKFTYLKILKKTTKEVNLRLVILICSIIPLLFFYLNTQMHERYCHPAIIFIITYCIIYKHILLGVLGSLAYLLNLDSVLKSLTFQNYGVLIFNDIFISILFLVVIIYLFIELYKIKFDKVAT